MNDQNDNEIIVIGGGPAGLLCALAMHDAGHHVLLIAGKSRSSDNRAIAILQPQWEFLAKHSIDRDLRETSYPLKSLKIVDATSRPLRSPSVHFHGDELNLECFGYAIRNDKLVKILREKLEKSDVKVIEDEADQIVLSDKKWHIKLKNNQKFIANHLIAADGKNSPTRQAAGIACKRWSYPQTALTFDLEHHEPHRGCSTEFHTPSGPLTYVPQDTNNSNVVWLMTTAQAEELRHSTPEKALSAMGECCGWHLGPKKIISPIMSWPLEGLRAERFASHNVFLVGESAHAFPPIGAQGFNMSIRDCMALLEVLEQPTAQSEHYHQARKNDVWLRDRAVDALDNMLLHHHWPLDALRCLSLTALQNITPLRKKVMRTGLGHSL